MKRRYYYWLIDKRYNLFVFFICLYITGSCFWIFTQDSLEDHTFSAQNTCPACIGETFCQRLHGGSVYLSRLYSFNIFGKSSVPAQLATRAGMTNVVIHRLQENQAFDDLDLRICVEAKLKPGCSTSSAILTLSLVKNLKQFVKSLKQNPTMMFYCPSTRLMERMLKRTTELPIFDNDNPSRKLAQLWTTAHVSSVPLLLQVSLKKTGIVCILHKFHSSC